MLKTITTAKLNGKQCEIRTMTPGSVETETPTIFPKPSSLPAEAKVKQYSGRGSPSYGVRDEYRVSGLAASLTIGKFRDIPTESLGEFYGCQPTYGSTLPRCD